MSNIIKINRKLRVLGIDLGTTNSSVAEIFCEDDSHDIPTAQCLEIEQITEQGIHTGLLVPSYLALYDGREIIGEGAKQLRSLAHDVERNLEYRKTLFYECKNDIGSRLTYHKAPEGYKSAAEISSRILKFLYDAALSEDKTPFDRVVITVPASFQLSQRMDTLKAAELAGIKVGDGDLIDEPTAAFLDYIESNRGTFSIETDKNKKIVILDFGGGTCDVVIFQFKIPKDKNQLYISPLSVSRYHRLGGGDIDAAILYEILIPQILEQNGLSKFDLSYEDKKKHIEPAFIGIAESLKIGLCKQITRLNQFHKDVDKKSLVKTNPGTSSCKLKDKREIKLKNPTLSAMQFEEILTPFLDKDLLYARESEYGLTCSIFAPLQDALDRSGLVREKIDYCLMIGGSCLIPQLIEPLQDFFNNAQILINKNFENIQTAVAKGAAYHAFALAVNGKGLIQPVCSDTISIKTSDGLIDLVNRGELLPYPCDGSFEYTERLAIPQTIGFEKLDLRVEIVAKEDDRILHSRIWEIEGPVNKGDKLSLNYRYNQNQIIELTLNLKNDISSQPFGMKIEKPLTNVVYREVKKSKIEEIEEDLKSGKIPKSQHFEKMTELARLYADINQHEKAIDYLRRLLLAKNRPDPYILTLMGIYAGEIGDLEKEEKYYREAAKASSWAIPLFNLALSKKRQKQINQAVELIDQAIKKDVQAPYLVLRAQLSEAMRNKDERDKYLEEAFSEFKDTADLDDWELGWYLTAAVMAKDKDKEKEANTEQLKRSRGASESMQAGMLPISSRELQIRGL